MSAYDDLFDPLYYTDGDSLSEGSCSDYEWRDDEVEVAEAHPTPPERPRAFRVFPRVEEEGPWKEDYDMTLMIGSWRAPIRLSQHKGGFLSDWYELYGSPGVLLDVTGHFDFIPQQWMKLKALAAWEELPLSFFDRRDGFVVHIVSIRLERVYYREVEETARTLGTVTSHWECFTVVDRSLPQQKRMELYRAIGGTLAEARVGLTEKKEYPKNLAWLLTEAESTLLASARDDEKDSISNTLRGIRHNATLLMLTDPNHAGPHMGVPHGKENNKMTGNGLTSCKDCLYGLNWSYIIWEDVVELYRRQGINEVPETLLYLIGSSHFVSNWDVSCSLTTTGILITEYAIPLLYELGLKRIDVFPTMNAMGLDELYGESPKDDKVAMPAIRDEISLGNIVSNVTRTVLRVTLKEGDEALDELIASLGWFAAHKIYMILLKHNSQLNFKGKQVLSYLDILLPPMLDAIEKARVLPLWDLAQNDTEGMLLSSLPLPD